MTQPVDPFRRYQEFQRCVGWSEDDSQNVRAVAGLLDPHLGPLVDDFDAEIDKHLAARRVITGGPDQIARLKGALVRWLRELLSGPYDQDDVVRRMQVARRHVEIGLDQVFANVTLSRLRSGLVAALGAEVDPGSSVAAILSLNKLLDLDLAIIEDTYQADRVRQPGPQCPGGDAPRWHPHTRRVAYRGPRRGHDRRHRGRHLGGPARTDHGATVHDQGPGARTGAGAGSGHPGEKQGEPAGSQRTRAGHHVHSVSDIRRGIKEESAIVTTTASILVVDDDQDTCQNLNDILTDLGYRVDTAPDGPFALELVRKNPYDVALLDFMMPGMNGLELYREIRKARAGTVGIIVSAYTNTMTDQDALGAGVWQVLTKPVDFQRLLGLVDEALDQPLIMVVDDDPDLCANLWGLLRERGYRVCLAHDAETAADRLRGRDYKVMLIDLRLLDGYGSGVFRMVREAHPEAHTVIITGSARELDPLMQQLLREGANAVCHKPFDMTVLLHTLKTLSY